MHTGDDRDLQWHTGDFTGAHVRCQGIHGLCIEAERECRGDDSENTGGYRGFSYGQVLLELAVCNVEYCTPWDTIYLNRYVPHTFPTGKAPRPDRWHNSRSRPNCWSIEGTYMLVVTTFTHASLWIRGFDPIFVQVNSL